MSSRERLPHNEFPFTKAITGKVISTTEKILEKRYPDENLNRQMLKSPDVLLGGAIASGIISLTVAPTEAVVEIGKAVVRSLRNKAQRHPTDRS